MLLGFRDFLETQIPESAREHDYLLVAAPDVKNWDINTTAKAVGVASRVGTRVTDALGIAKSVGGPSGAVFGAKLGESRKTVEGALQAVSARLEQAPVEAPPAVPASFTGPVAVPDLPPEAVTIPQPQPAPAPTPKTSSLSPRARIGLVIVAGVAVVAAVGGAIYVATRKPGRAADYEAA